MAQGELAGLRPMLPAEQALEAQIKQWDSEATEGHGMQNMQESSPKSHTKNKASQYPSMKPKKAN
jgi:hypothetical protein